MRDMAKRDTTIDLITLTREDIFTKDLPCISVKKPWKQGYSPRFTIGSVWIGRFRETKRKIKK
jgi:hypothetical protein